MERIFTISQVAEELDVSAGTIRNWEKEFSDFLVVRRDEQGNRYYTLADIEKFRRIAELREEGFSLGAIRKVFEKFTSGSVEVENSVTREENSLVPLNQAMIKTVISEQVQAAMQQVLLGIKEHIDQRFSQFEQSYSHLHGEVSLLKQEIDSVVNQLPEQTEAIKKSFEQMYKDLPDEVKLIKSDINRLLELRQIEAQKDRIERTDEILKELRVEKELRRQALKEWAKLGFFGRIGKDKDEYIERYVEEHFEEYMRKKEEDV
ncbi:hypothetical protein DNHGIG_40670 [Collibacillus ludicampi]|uniref:HTH merR-type domain-containing protein n=1 Tax=Collibacillus ludicampi TaxID=2771369 RepID=A0AAV4LL40_9BACL|nr:helix-turn-helix domain-containing protein [Collibacillus ludicampi]GIM48518.1 hypothetical protein DNHGIG_40670 [Collibacillus ludicampi]